MRVRRSLGQNFLVDPNLQARIVAALDLSPADTVVEIGPGRGALTRHMAGGPARLVAVEIDDDLAPELQDRYREHPDIQVHHADILDWDPTPVLASGTVKVVGNIPYNITTPIIFRLLEWRPVPERIVLMVQKEVADRILAAPGQKAYGALTVGVRAQARVKRLFHVGRKAFRPVPAVDSTVLLLRPAPTHGPGTGDPLRDLTRAAFGLRRKQLQKILRTAAGYRLEPDDAVSVLAGVGVRPEERPEALDPETFVRLAAALQSRGFPRKDGDAS